METETKTKSFCICQNCGRRYHHNPILLNLRDIGQMIHDLFSRPGLKRETYQQFCSYRCQEGYIHALFEKCMKAANELLEFNRTLTKGE